MLKQQGPRGKVLKENHKNQKTKLKTNLLRLGILSLVFLFGFSLVNLVQYNTTAEDTPTHKLTINKQTKDNKDGKFTYRIKAWKEETAKKGWKMVASYGFSDTTVRYQQRIRYTLNSKYFPLSLDPYIFNEDAEYEYDDIGLGANWEQIRDELQRSGDVESLEKVYLNSEDEVPNGMTEVEFSKDGVSSVIFLHELNWTVMINGRTYNLYSDASSSAWDEGFSVAFGGANDECSVYAGFYVYDDDGSVTDYYEMIPVSNETVQTKNYLDLSSQLGSPVADNTYEFTLSNSESKDITIPEGYKYEVEELTQDGWELVSINNDTTRTKVEETMGTEDMSFDFLNQKTSQNQDEDQKEDEDVKPVPNQTTNNIPVNPKTEDQKILPLMIMAGSAIVLTICSIILQIWKRRGYGMSR